ncbi:MAG: stage II sporulation protein M, partial [Acutalibacteraceae bacterium]|nr:stage II sporulation protein M [Acutalibacteraceae bacterium]
MRRTNLFFVKVPKEHRGTRTVGSRSGGFSSGYRGGILQIFRQQFLLVFLGLFLIAGLILGVIFIRNADYSLLKTLDFVFFSNVKARSALPVLSIFVASLASSFLFLLFCFLCGLSIWGAYCVPLAPLFRGFGMGITAGYLYAAYGFQGFLFHLAVILPGAFICLIAILIASRESMLFSKKIHLGRKTEEQEAQPKNNVRHFFIRFSILTGILIIGALVD